MNERNNLRWLVLALLLLLMAACSPPSGNAPSASSVLPTLSEYNTIEGVSLQDALAAAATTGSLGTGNVVSAGIVQIVDRVGDCYRNEGAVDFRFYTNKQFAAVAGLVVVANRNVLLDPNTFLRCTGLIPNTAASEGQGGGSLQPCAHAYSTVIGGDTFDIAYVASDTMACQDFCAGLPACTGHRGG